MAAAAEVDVLAHIDLTVDHYGALGLAKAATEKEIRKAYKGLALKNHPDKNKDDPGATERFKNIALAYEVLGDQRKRRYYDSRRAVANLNFAAAAAAASSSSSSSSSFASQYPTSGSWRSSFNFMPASSQPGASAARGFNFSRNTDGPDAGRRGSGKPDMTFGMFGGVGGLADAAGGFVFKDTDGPQTWSYATTAPPTGAARPQFNARAFEADSAAASSSSSSQGPPPPIFKVPRASARRPESPHPNQPPTAFEMGEILRKRNARANGGPPTAEDLKASFDSHFVDPSSAESRAVKQEAQRRASAALAGDNKRARREAAQVHHQDQNAQATREKIAAATQAQNHYRQAFQGWKRGHYHTNGDSAEDYQELFHPPEEPIYNYAETKRRRSHRPIEEDAPATTTDLCFHCDGLGGAMRKIGPLYSFLKCSHCGGTGQTVPSRRSDVRNPVDVALSDFFKKAKDSEK